MTHEVHERRRIYEAQRPIHGERVTIERDLEPNRGNDLKGIPGVDVLDRLLNGGFVFLTAGVRRRGGDRVEIRTFTHRALRGACESSHVALDFGPSRIVRPGRIVPDDHIADDENGVAETIDGGEGTPDMPDHLRESPIVGRPNRELLDIADRVVREVADETSVEGRHPAREAARFPVGSGELLEEDTEDLEWISVGEIDFVRRLSQSGRCAQPP